MSGCGHHRAHHQTVAKKVAPGRGPGGGGPAAALSREHFLPFVEMAMWSSTPGVKYSAVSGLATLAKVEENKAAMGDVGALECLATIVYDGLELPADDVSSLDINRSPGLGGALAKAQQRLQSSRMLLCGRFSATAAEVAKLRKLVARAGSTNWTSIGNALKREPRGGSATFWCHARTKRLPLALGSGALEPRDESERQVVVS